MAHPDPSRGAACCRRIDREALDAAQTWRSWFETVAPFRAQAWQVRVDASLIATDAGMLLRVNAASQLRAAAEALGRSG